MRIVLTAVPGCGKTTIVKFVQEKVKINFVNFGDVMFEIAKKRYGLKNRDEMRKKLSLKEYGGVQLEAAKKIGKMKSVIIDTHSTIRTVKGFWPGLPEKIIKALNPDMFVIVEKSAKDIITSRSEDKTRGTRDVETVKDVEEHQMINRCYASVYSVLAECSLVIIDLHYNEKKKFDHSKDAANQIAKMIGELNA